MMNVEAALGRIYRWILVFGVTGALGMLIWKGWASALGFALGAAVSGLNFHWIKGAADVLMAKFTQQPNSQPPKLIAAKFVLRYALIGLAGYGIFKVLRVSLTAFLGGLLVVAAAILAEIAYELLFFRGTGISNGT